MLVLFISSPDLNPSTLHRAFNDGRGPPLCLGDLALPATLLLVVKAPAEPCHAGPVGLPACSGRRCPPSHATYCMPQLASNKRLLLTSPTARTAGATRQVV
ncbi:hypothetical protein PAHAL_8G166400 [Panicum hallii]|uniref:Uncharacterized protein n=1 Tax=Panicum hallii TaxID=206008 RepID=A0A2T8I952_9POAL|nr:hypothetical protein PAHAL_8G166400 [Panicum hallii]